MKTLTERSLPNYYVLSLVILWTIVGFTWGMNYEASKTEITCGENGNWIIFEHHGNWKDAEPIYFERKYVI